MLGSTLSHYKKRIITLVKKKTFVALSTLMLAVLVAGFLSMSGPALSQKNDSNKGAWQYRCADGEDGAEKRCEMAQRLSESESGKRVVEFVLTDVTGEDGQHRAVIVLPLGVAIQPGVRLRVDEGESYGFNISHCLPDGCIAIVDLPQSLVTEMKRGKTAKLVMKTFQGKTVAMNLSLTGFTKAYNKID